MSRTVLGIDVAVGVVVAALVLIISPGAAVTGMIALVVLLICLFSAVWERRRGRRPRPRGRRPRHVRSRRR